MGVSKIAEEFRSHLLSEVHAGKRVLLRWALESEYQRVSDELSTVTISTGQVDRYKTILNPEGWDLKAFRKNPVVLWAHMRSELPIGNSKREFVEGSKLKSELEWVPSDMNPWAGVVRRFYDEKYLRGWSVGFVPLKVEVPESMDEPLRFEENELVEYSAVPVPANPGALSEGMVPEEYADHASSLMRSIGGTAWAQTGAGTWRPVPAGAIEGTKPGGKEVTDKPWDATAAQCRVMAWAKGDAEKKAKAYAMVAGSDMLFPHHDVEDGSLVTIKAGVVEALAYLVAHKDAFTPVQFHKARLHLEEHMAQFGILESADFIEARKGAVIRQTNLDKLVQAVELINAVIDTAKPDDDDDDDEGDEDALGDAAPAAPAATPAPSAPAPGEKAEGDGDGGVDGDGIEGVDIERDEVEVEGLEVEE